MLKQHKVTITMLIVIDVWKKPNNVIWCYAILYNVVNIAMGNFLKPMLIKIYYCQALSKF